MEHDSERFNIPSSADPLIAGLRELAWVEKLILFGSRAFGDHDDRSDIDLAVVGHVSRWEWRRTLEWAYHAPTLYWVSLVHWNSSPAALKERILHSGVTIYDKEAAGQPLQS